MSSSNTETRTRILQTTVKILEAQGGQGVRMGDIAKATGISRQAVYLHFASRTELLVATTRYLDQQLDVDSRLAASRAATSGVQRLVLFIETWGNYIPEIYGVAKALMLAQTTDEAAAAAWRDRMAAVRDGCRAAVEAIHADHHLATGWTPEQATDALWTLLSVSNWEALTRDCGWSNQQYVERMQQMAARILLGD